ncbi:MAG TPA: cytochrome P450 [Haliangiales bacterium]|nr:cytochrome P450 [Haliangiales bacterium]
MHADIAPGPSRRELVFRWPKLHAQPLAELEALWRRYGDVVRVPVVRDYFLLVDPAAIRRVLRDNRKNYDKADSFDDLRLLVGDGLLTARADAWVAQRRLLAKVFSTRAAHGDLPVVTRAAEALAATWDAALAGTTSVSRLVSADFARLTLRVAGESLLGADASAQVAALGDALDRAQAALIDRMRSVSKLPMAVPTPANRGLRKAIAALDGILADVLARLPAASDAAPGFLRRLATIGEGAAVRDEAMTFLLAGYDTTSNGLAWIVHLLSRHPDAQERVRAEIRAAGGDLDQMPLLDAVIAEGLRLFPPVPIMLRDAREDDVVGGFRIPAGSTVACVAYLAHRHPRHWPDPEAFRPERFAGGGCDAYMPFGIQPRGCIGEPMARLWMKVALAVLVGHFRFVADPHHPVEPHALITLMPRHGLRVRLARA